jgi:uncharacterized protein
MRKLARWLLLAVPALYILVCSGLYFQQNELIFRPEVLPADFRFSFPQPFREVNVPVEGATLNALYFTVPQSRGVVLFFHGNSGSLRRWGEVADSFTGRDYDLLVFDYRGYGKSTGKIKSERQLHDDADRVYAYVRERYPAENIIVYGRSLGTGIAAQLAVRHTPKMLILETPYVSLKDLTATFYPYVPGFILKYPLRTDLALPQVKSPVYLFHGTNDAVVPYPSSERLLTLISSAKDNDHHTWGRTQRPAPDAGIQRGARSFLAIR